MKTVMIFGTFDILHSGHFHLFEEARCHGEKLIAVLARDENVLRIKGFLPFHNENERKENLSHIDLIDKAMLGNIKDVYKIIMDTKPDVIVLGYDQVSFTDRLSEELKRKSLNTKIVRTTGYKKNYYKTNKIKEYLNKVLCK
jgi:cytidyltransferase-like protein